MLASEDLKKSLEKMTHHPGVYRMLDADGTLIYVGKAKDLKKRVASYFGKKPDSPKTRALIRQIRDVDVTVTRTEAEALLLESNLIKQHKPRYNVVLRDDKSYPYLYLSTDNEFPRLSFYRGAKSGAGQYFGPYPSAKSARRTLNLTQKLFRIRQCDDNFFRNRSRPCLQYQIKRCTAPCVGLVSPGDYREDVKHTVMFLEGRNEEVIRELTAPMQKAADGLDYERAAQYRDQIISLRKIQENQYITAPRGELDIVACYMEGGYACVQVFFIRGGLNLGNKAFFPGHTGELTEAQVLNAFLPQYYLTGSRNRPAPGEILVSHPVADAETLMTLLSERRGKSVRLRQRHRSERRKWVEMALNNAEIALRTRLSSRDDYVSRFENLQGSLGLNEPVERIECFDVSHTSGEATVAACVVFNHGGAVKTDYRKFNIKDAPAGDDYAAISQAFNRRYSRIKKEEGKLPDLILIDGGKGQVGSIRAVAEELQLDEVTLLGVAKGKARKPGMERLVFSDGKTEASLAPDSPALHLIQEIRDEAHRFAVTGHRQQRNRKRSRSVLEDVEGVGSKRRRELIRYFGGLQGVSRAGVEELARAPGISHNLAKKIYASFHGDEA
ncbi:MAG: excinuclease ABC subunit UvrC [Gammaproteobacteria bacterium]|nr:excinuclease ABC subunit UvrC [Gammaproteobacteria bacterium]